MWDAPWGNNGTGVVVGFIDTGVRGTHEAIRDQYMNDGRAWRDPYNQYSVPTDIYNHGTHTVGSVVGKYALININSSIPLFFVKLTIIMIHYSEICS